MSTNVKNTRASVLAHARTWYQDRPTIVPGLRGHKNGSQPEARAQHEHSINQQAQATPRVLNSTASGDSEPGFDCRAQNWKIMPTIHTTLTQLCMARSQAEMA